jgi:transmembrane sensor
MFFVDKDYIGNLFRRYFFDEATHAEREALFNELVQHKDDEAWQEIMDQLYQQTPADANYDPVYWKSALKKIIETETQRESEASSAYTPPSPASIETDEDSVDNRVVPMHRRRIFRLAAAAVFMGMITLGIWFYSSQGNTNNRTEIVSNKPVDVKAPETNRAMITLANGRQIFLDNTNIGELVQQGNIKLVKLSNGQIAYQTASYEIGKVLQYNTLSNPRGSKVIDMTLSDGSRVWLNAGSSVTYPIAFIGSERKVTVNGEAYFEISHDKTKPFSVSKGGTIIQVLGTHFNVNAYDDEADIKVTLLEGSVKVSNDADSKTIKPGEQAVAFAHSPFTINHSPDLEQTMAWKNGMFTFKRTDIKEIMRQIARWYDVEVNYGPGVAQQLYNGDVSRNANLSEVLKVLEYTGAKFKVEGKMITVQK